MSILNWFMYRSPKERKRQSEHYMDWAFPHGEKQRAQVEALLKELFDDDLKLSLASYLIGRQGVLGDWEDMIEKKAACTEETLKKGVEPLRNVLQGRKADIPLYLALIEADYLAGSELNYPDVDSIRARAKEIKEFI